MMDRYQLVRFYENGKRRIIETGLTLEEVQKHCQDKRTEGRTGGGVRWFDGFQKM